MLVLSRKVGEGIVIDGRIRVHVVRVSSRRVRLVVDAPQSVTIDRTEIWQEKAEKRGFPPSSRSTEETAIQ